MNEALDGAQIKSGGAGGKSTEKKIIKEVVPTLFVAVGGTGMEILMRLRRGLLAYNWGNHSSPYRLASLSEFPIAEFINFDLAQGDVLERGKSANSDTQASLVTFSSSERLTETLPVHEYFADEVTLSNHPHIARWFPLSMQQIKKLNLEQGAGQIRSASRLFFFDKVDKLESMMKKKLQNLKSAATSQDAALKKLNVAVSSTPRIVVVCSLAGGTGSGSFIDVGWLAGQVLHDVYKTHEGVQLIALLPSGFTAANEQRCKSNSYAGLTELDSAMRGDLLERYVGKWKRNDAERSLHSKPFSDVYLIDTVSCAVGNVATKDVKDIYQMVADSLLEDFSNADFAAEKRSVAINQANAKMGEFCPPVNEGRFKDLSLSFPKMYSSFGLARIDTMERERLAQLSNEWTEDMLRTFFGVSARNEALRIKASDAHRDKFLHEYLHLVSKKYGEADNDFPEVARSVDAGEGWNALISEYKLVDDLLESAGESTENILTTFKTRVSAEIDNLPRVTGNDTSETAKAAGEILVRLKSDLYRTAGMKNRAAEDRLDQAVNELHGKINANCQTYFYSVLDDTNSGGLDFVTSLISESTALIENKSPVIGVIAALGEASKRYEIARNVAQNDFEDCLERLKGLKKPLLGFGAPVEESSREIVLQVKKALEFYARFALKAIACDRATKLLDKLCNSMGRRVKDDDFGNPIYSGFLLEIQTGRLAVEKTIAELEAENKTIEEQLTKEHVTLIPIKVEELSIQKPEPAVMHAWAKSALEGQGGSREIFQKLQNDADKAGLLATIRRVAAAEITKRYFEIVQDDPLFTALEEMKNNNPAELEALFRKLISRAMPWVGIQSGSSFNADKDQYKFYMGVSNAGEFKKKFESIVARANGQPVEISYCDTGQPGRLVCYSELSGYPVGAIHALSEWYNQYSTQSMKATKGEVAPIHNFIDPSLFTHPRVPTGNRINSLADDFKLFQASIMLGLILRANDRKLSSGGIYRWKIEGGDWVNLISEPSIRQDGLESFSQARDSLDQELKKTTKRLTQIQKLALLGLIAYYKEKVYPRPYSRAGSGSQTPVNTFPYFCFTELEEEWKKKLLNDIDVPVSTDDISEMLSAVREDWNEFFQGWTEEVEGSETECYPHEVKPINHAQQEDKITSTGNFVPEFLAKRKVTGIFLKDPEALAKKLDKYLPESIKKKQSVVPEGLVPDGRLPPPLPVEAAIFYIAFSGQQGGPYTRAQLGEFIKTGQLTKTTLCWRDGLPVWQAADSIPEIAGLWPALPPPLPSI